MKFNPVFINGKTLSDTWWQLLYNINKYGRKYLITKGSYEGSYRIAFDDVSGFTEYPHTLPLAPIMPEGISIPAPTDDADIEKYFLEYLMNGIIQDNEHYKYGTFIVGGEYKLPEANFTVWDLDGSGGYYFAEGHPTQVIVPNQLDWIIDHFKKYGFGNEHCYLTVGYPESNFAYDIPYTNEQERGTSPCLRGLDFRIIEEDIYVCKECGIAWTKEQTLTTNGKNILCRNDREILHNKPPEKLSYLLTKVIYRSWDLFSGFPVNMGGFTLLNEFMAQELNILPGPLSFTCKSLHLYDFQLDPLRAWLRKG